MCCTMHASEDSRRDLNAIEKQIETARKETRRSLTRVVRSLASAAAAGGPGGCADGAGDEASPGLAAGSIIGGDAPRL
jgi:hypothetical protein